jgi:hypothetical protein
LPNNQLQQTAPSAAAEPERWAATFVPERLFTLLGEMK